MSQVKCHIKCKRQLAIEYNELCVIIPFWKVYEQHSNTVHVRLSGSCYLHHITVHYLLISVNFFSKPLACSVPDLLGHSLFIVYWSLPADTGL